MDKKGSASNPRRWKAETNQTFVLRAYNQEKKAEHEISYVWNTMVGSEHDRKFLPRELINFHSFRHSQRRIVLKSLPYSVTKARCSVMRLKVTFTFSERLLVVHTTTYFAFRLVLKYFCDKL